MTNAKTQMVQALHDGVDPFSNVPPYWQPDLTDKWDSHHALFDLCVAELRPSVIVEVGSFLGASARHFASALHRERLDGVVVCVDTWLGEQVLWNSPEWRPHLRLTHGRPEYYQAFMANAVQTGQWPYLCPLPMPSPNAARYLKSRGVAADLVYIDGSHDQGDVYHDLVLYWGLVLRPGGVMLIDDYDLSYPGVMNDVDRFASERSLTRHTDGLKVRLRKERA